MFQILKTLGDWGSLFVHNNMLLLDHNNNNMLLLGTILRHFNPLVSGIQFPVQSAEHQNLIQMN